MESLFVQQEKEAASERRLNPDETSDAQRLLDPNHLSQNQHLRLPSRIHRDGTIENQHFENGTFEDMKKRGSSSSPASSPSTTQSGPARKNLAMLNRYNIQSTHRRLILSHPIYTNSPSSSLKKHVNTFKDSKKSSSRPTESSQQMQMSHSSSLVPSSYNTSPKRSLKDNLKLFDGSKTSMTKNTVMLSTGFKGAIGSSRSHSKRIQTSYRTSKKIKELRAHFGHLGEKQHRQIRRFQEDESGLSCDDKMFLRMYPVPKTDPLGLDEILKED
ncbi:hypothetical protein B9Z55_007646 [Caenorhabditis nigoni]|uniref:Uncharacterized protein n=1 Tax=Caenorhabditis nigoni TaxID=1611254 RepID=A0A2G5VAJ1_9PELO|nr:hypothetical protein B9Z55_007646 [Caenorhabditis nigoni]